MRRWSFAKGHGTENDFVVLTDREGMLPITPRIVRQICDRRAGVGADGILRAVHARHVPEWAGEGDVWFMDYRNADGSLAEMCGNGIRVFVRHLLEQDLAFGPVVAVATRAGLREATVLADGRIRVAMGPVTVGDGRVEVSTADARTFAAIPVDVGNPHAVSFSDDLELIELTTAPRWSPAAAFPAGVNLEFVRPVAERHIEMRVFERGSGETRSCGTGTVAAAAATDAHRPRRARRAPSGGLAGSAIPVTYRVDVPGGSVEVELGEQAYLTGPAVIVAHGELVVPEEE